MDMKLKLIIICLLLGNISFAQGTRFTTTGIIDFEKKINAYALIQKKITKDNESFYGAIFEDYKKKHPQFATYKSTLTFAGNKTLYKPAAEDEEADGFGMLGGQGQPNTIFTDVLSKSSITQKAVFEQVFLVKDSTRKINWKLTDETREIAGYNCRRANALILDSIYVVAFYTDQIPVSGGPESFTGLPGMILGVAMPHENVTWFATKVTDVNVPESDLKIPTKGKSVNNKQLRATLESALKNWGEYAKSYFKAFLL
jgi:GLPGLI family protein